MQVVVLAIRLFCSIVSVPHAHTAQKHVTVTARAPPYDLAMQWFPHPPPRFSRFALLVCVGWFAAPALVQFDLPWTQMAARVVIIMLPIYLQFASCVCCVWSDERLHLFR